MKKYTLLILSGVAVPALVFSQDATEIPIPAQSEADIQVRGEETSAEAKIRRLQQQNVDPVGTTAGEMQQNARAVEARRTAIAEKRAAMQNDTANPDATPLKANMDAADTIDTSDLANPESQPLQDTVERANPEAMPVEENRDAGPNVDTAQGLANPESTPTGVDADTTPVQDRMPVVANPEATANTANLEAMPRSTETNPTADGEVSPADEAAANGVARMPAPSEANPRTEDATLKTNALADPAMPNATTNPVPENASTDPQMSNPTTNPTAENASTTPQESNATTNPAATNPTTQATAMEQERTRKNANRKAPNERTNRVLEDKRRDRQQDAAVAERIEDDDDAQSLIYSILGGAVAGGVAARVATSDDRARAEAEAYRRGQRLPVTEVGRTQTDRDQSVNYLVRRFNGSATMQDAPYYRDQRRAQFRQPLYYDNNRRVVRYATRSEIPPVLIASERLDRVDLMPAQQMNYRPVAQQANRYYNEVPDAYNGEGAYAVSYSVDPDSAVSRDDILFQQGSTAFADAYSYDLVLDLAEAMKSSQLGNASFIIEGHASAEGSYGANLALSQERAERIARDLVAYGVEADRLVPVGYGEAEANYPADSPESQRMLDRRVMVFRME